jgi:hypothetical protein
MSINLTSTASLKTPKKLMSAYPSRPGAILTIESTMQFTVIVQVTAPLPKTLNKDTLITCGKSETVYNALGSARSVYTAA